MQVVLIDFMIQYLLRVLKTRGSFVFYFLIYTISLKIRKLPEYSPVTASRIGTNIMYSLFMFMGFSISQFEKYPKTLHNGNKRLKDE